MSKVEVPAKPGSASLAEFEIVVAVAPESGADQLVRDLQRARAKVRRLWPMPDKLPSDADVLVVEFSDRLTDRLPWAPGESRSAVVPNVTGATLKAAILANAPKSEYGCFVVPKVISDE